MVKFIIDGDEKDIRANDRIRATLGASVVEGKVSSVVDRIIYVIPTGAGEPALPIAPVDWYIEVLTKTIHQEWEDAEVGTYWCYSTGLSRGVVVKGVEWGEGVPDDVVGIVNISAIVTDSALWTWGPSWGQSS